MCQSSYILGKTSSFMVHELGCFTRKMNHGQSHLTKLKVHHTAVFNIWYWTRKLTFSSARQIGATSKTPKPRKYLIWKIRYKLLSLKQDRNPYSGRKCILLLIYLTCRNLKSSVKFLDDAFSIIGDILTTVL